MKIHQALVFFSYASEGEEASDDSCDPVPVMHNPAGYLIVSESGGMITGLAGEPYSIYDGDILGSNGLIHDQMVEVAQRVRRRRS